MFQKAKRILSSILVLVMAVTLMPSAVHAENEKNASDFRIILGDDASEMQEYAAKELQKYLFQISGESVEIVTEEEGTDVNNAYVLGTAGANSLLAPVAEEVGTLGEQGYVLKKVDSTLYIGGYDDEGTLYGVYGLLDDYYGIGFYFSGDAIPEQKTALTMPEVNEAKTPRQYMRGVLPWTNFPQSATVYSTEDWKFIIDQMARMRMNFLNIHNYNGQNGHNEVYHNFTYNGITSRTWNPTAKTGHGWFGPTWDVNQYRFGATDLFDDYDFGTDATLHNDNLDNLENSAKGISQFQYIIDYAHTRGVKIGLGLDIDLVMPDYGVAADDPELLQARAKAIVDDYPDLDTAILYISEMIVNNPGELAKWNRCFDKMYSVIKEECPDMQIAVSGWGISPSIANSMPEDVVIAPIAPYSAGFANGAKDYPGREYWGGPWSERDFDSSEYFYPFNIHLEDTIKSYQENKDSMEGLFTLSWRLTDGVDVKMMYIAKAPWDTAEKYTTAQAVYDEYAERCYGSENKQDIGKLICQDERTVVPTGFGECQNTPGFGGGNRSGDVDKLNAMIARVDSAITKTGDSGNQARLRKLRDRLTSAMAYCKLDQSFNTTDWENLDKDFKTFAQAFMTRVDDISSLGNNLSVQNRFVQLRYEARENQLRNSQEIKAPLNVVAKGTPDGAFLTWEYEKVAVESFAIYRNGVKVGNVNADVREYTDVFDGEAEYTIKAVVDGTEGTASIAQTVMAGSADNTAPQAIVVSPTTSVLAGQALNVKARILDERTYENLSATIYYRTLGSDEAYKSEAMEHRTKATFTASLDTTAYVNSGIEYYVIVSDGKNESTWPVTAPKLNAVCTVEINHTGSMPKAPMEIKADNGGITWSESNGDVFWYRIYRDDTPDFEPSSANLVTYVEQGTTSFCDVDADFDGQKLSNQTKYYRVTAVDKYLNESIPSEAVEVGPAPVDTLKETLFARGDEFYDCRTADGQTGSTTGTVLAWTVDGSYAKFEDMHFSPTQPFNTVEVKYSADRTGGKLQVWIDGYSENTGGTLLGEKDLNNTGNWFYFQSETITLEPGITGTHDVYFVMKRNSSTVNNLYNLDTFRFTYVPELSDTKVIVTTNDMMAYKEKADSTLREDADAITNFGNEGDRIAVGKGFRADAENAFMGGATRKVALPGYKVQCFAYFGKVGDNFGYTDVPAGKVYLAYDKQYYANDVPNIAVYVNNVKKADVPLLADTGSIWNTGDHRIVYVDTGVVAEAGDTVKFQIDGAVCNMNGIKMFVDVPVIAQQMSVNYSNTADTQYGLYVNGERIQTVTLPNSSGQKKDFIIKNVAAVDAKVELVADTEDVNANGGAKAAVYQITLDTEVSEDNCTVTVTHNEGGSIEPAGTEGKVIVPIGGEQLFTFTPDVGYAIGKVVVNGVDYGVRSSYEFENLTYDATLEVEFVKNAEVNVFEVNIDSKLANGKITSSHSNARPGQPVILTVTADEGYRLKTGSLKYVTAKNPEGVAIHEISTQFSMPAEHVTVTAEFEPISPVEPEEPSNVIRDLLQKTYDLVKDEDTSGVVDSAVKFFEDALNTAKALLDEPNASNEDMLNAWNNLVDATHGLGLLKGDKSILEVLIQKAEDMVMKADKYVTANWQLLLDELEDAKGVLADQDAMDDDIRPAEDELMNAILAQRFKAQKDILNDLIGKAEGLNLEDYTEESVKAFKVAFMAAKDVMADENLSEDDQVKVDAAVKALADAMDGLKLASGDNDGSNNTDGSQAKNDTKDSPKTGDTAPIILWLTVVLLMAALAAVLKMKNRYFVEK